MSTKSKDAKSFPLPDVLRDLALLRVSDVQLASLLPPDAGNTSSHNKELDEDLERSYRFVKEARAAIRMRDSEKVEEQAGRLENVRNGLEELVNGLEGDRK